MSVHSSSIAPAPRRIGRLKRFLHTEGAAFYGFIGLWLLGLIFLQLFPMVSALIISFTNFNGMDLPNTAFIGWSNYLEALKSPDARYSLGLTLIYTALSVPMGLIAALALAMLLNRKIPFRGLYRTAFYLPTMVPLAATALIFKSIYEPNFGFLNLFISIFRPGTAINWLLDYGLYCLVSMSIWTCGTVMVIFLAGLQGIPDDLTEAAQIDGANKWQVFKYVTWPLLSPITYFQLMLGIINALQMWVPANILSSTVDANSFWNPKHSMYVFPSYALNQMMSAQRFGYGVALVWILFVLVLVLTQIVRATSRFWVFYAVEQEGGHKER
ncbi:MAG: sugar ABC transporter permease [Firmicutes bacterium]|nr:sugar ABC transporter permease [Bacillota bacterium]